MSKDEVRHTSSTGGQKAGNDERHDLIPSKPLRMLARHYGIGAKKYDDNNWRKGYDWKLSFAAMMRHAWQFWGGEDIDEETGNPHLIAVAWHALALTEFMDTHPEFDTRLVTVQQRGIQDGQKEQGVTTIDSQKLELIQKLVKNIGRVRDPVNLPFNDGMDHMADAIQRILDS